MAAARAHGGLQCAFHEHGAARSSAGPVADSDERNTERAADSIP